MTLTYEQINRSLKMVLKASGLTYKQLAKKLDMSEAGVKRLLNAADCSMQRILKICDVVGVSLNEIIEISDCMDEEIQNFTEPQIDLFAKSFKHLMYFYKLKIAGVEPNKIAEQWGLTKKENHSILYDLDRVNLIKVLPEGQIEVLGRRNVRWKNLGRSFLKMKYQLTQELFEEFKSETAAAANGFFPIYHLQMSEKTHRDLYRDLDELVDKYVKLSTRENYGLKKKDIQPLTMAFLLAPIEGFSTKKV